MTRVFGIGSCDSCRAAIKFLAEQGIEVRLHDFRKDGLDVKSLGRWCDELGWEALLNKRSLTWRRIPETDRQGLDRERALALMLDNPTLIKRPVIEHGERLAIGFSRDSFARLLAD